jgi:hypothetical protein
MASGHAGSPAQGRVERPPSGLGRPQWSQAESLKLPGGLLVGGNGHKGHLHEFPPSMVVPIAVSRTPDGQGGRPSIRPPDQWAVISGLSVWLGNRLHEAPPCPMSTAASRVAPRAWTRRRACQPASNSPATVAASGDAVWRKATSVGEPSPSYQVPTEPRHRLASRWFHSRLASAFPVITDPTIVKPIKLNIQLKRA